MVALKVDVGRTATVRDWSLITGRGGGYKTGGGGT